MSDVSNLINEKIVNNSYDVFWQDISEKIKDFSPKKVLVLSILFQNPLVEDGLLKKMMDVCKLSSDEYNLLQIEKDSKISWNKLKAALQPKVVFMFGIYPAQLGVSAIFYINAYNDFNDCFWIPAPSLVDLEQNDEVKKALWKNAMKPIFIDGLLGKI